MIPRQDALLLRRFQEQNQNPLAIVLLDAQKREALIQSLRIGEAQRNRDAAIVAGSHVAFETSGDDLGKQRPVLMAGYIYADVNSLLEALIRNQLEEANRWILQLSFLQQLPNAFVETLHGFIQFTNP